MISNILFLLKKDLTIELRKKQTLLGIVLFTVSIVFLIYKTFNTVNAMTWNVLVWIVVLFSGVNAIAKSFIQESDQTQLFYYQLHSPYEVIIAKLLYNYLFLVLIYSIIIVSFFFFLGNPIKDYVLFIKGSSLGLLGISSIFTFISSISGQSGGSGASLLMSVLGIPLTLPCVLLLIKITAVSMRLIQDSEVSKDVLMLLGIDLLILGVILLLFSEMWKD